MDALSRIFLLLCLASYISYFLLPYPGVLLFLVLLGLCSSSHLLLSSKCEFFVCRWYPASYSEFLLLQLFSFLGFDCLQDRSAQNFVHDVCRQFQTCTPGQTNPTSDLTHTRTRTRIPTLWGARGQQGQPRGSAACLVPFFQKTPGGRKASLDQQDPHPAQKFGAVPVLQMVFFVVLVS